MKAGKMRKSDRLRVAIRKCALYPLPGAILSLALFALGAKPELVNTVFLAIACAVYLSIENLGYLPELKAEIEQSVKKPRDAKSRSV